MLTGNYGILSDRVLEGRKDTDNVDGLELSSFTITELVSIGTNVLVTEKA